MQSRGAQQGPLSFKSSAQPHLALDRQWDDQRGKKRKEEKGGGGVNGITKKPH